MQNLVKELHQQNTPSLFLKLDISRAFYNVSWEYILELLQCMNFPARWRDWIALLLSSATLPSEPRRPAPSPPPHRAREWSSLRPVPSPACRLLPLPPSPAAVFGSRAPPPAAPTSCCTDLPVPRATSFQPGSGVSSAPATMPSARSLQPSPARAPSPPCCCHSRPWCCFVLDRQDRQDRLHKTASTSTHGYTKTVPDNVKYHDNHVPSSSSTE